MEEAQVEILDISSLVPTSIRSLPNIEGGTTGATTEDLQHLPPPNTTDITTSGDERVIEDGLASPGAPAASPPADHTTMEGTTPEFMPLSRKTTQRPGEPVLNDAPGADSHGMRVNSVVASIEEEIEHTGDSHVSTLELDGRLIEVDIVPGAAISGRIMEKKTSLELTQPCATPTAPDEQATGTDHGYPMALCCERDATGILIVNDSSALRASPHNTRAEPSPVSTNSAGSREHRTRTTTPTLDLPWILRSFEADRCSKHEHKIKIGIELSDVCGCREGDVSDVGDILLHENVVASVAEAEVSRRIDQEKARAVEARRKKWNAELQR